MARPGNHEGVFQDVLASKGFLKHSDECPGSGKRRLFDAISLQFDTSFWYTWNWCELLKEGVLNESHGTMQTCTQGNHVIADAVMLIQILIITVALHCTCWDPSSACDDWYIDSPQLSSRVDICCLAQHHRCFAGWDVVFSSGSIWVHSCWTRMSSAWCG